MCSCANLTAWGGVRPLQKGVLAKVGPLSTLMDATGLTFYKVGTRVPLSLSSALTQPHPDDRHRRQSGIWNPTGWFACNSNGQGLDHAVLIGELALVQRFVLEVPSHLRS